MTLLEMKNSYSFKNPVIQTNFTADPAPMVYNDTVYLYTGHDEDGSTFFTMNEWRCYSSKDMVNWTDHGVPLDYKEFSWCQGDAWAGQCIERNGKFYFYVPVTKRGGGMVIGVAVSDSPTGPFVDPIGKPLVEDGWGDIDPSVFIDDDGQAYLYWGNPTLKYVKLNEDMISCQGEVVHDTMSVESFGTRVGNPDRATLYEEGPWFYKRNDLYYLVFAASGIPENIAYATSNSPTGPWTYRGIIMPTQGSSFTNHPGLVDFKGKSYFFYHNGALPGGGGFTRSVCIEEFEYNSDGTFPLINMTTEGVAAVATLNPYIRNEAETISWEYGIRTEACSQGGMNVCNIDDGDYIRVNNVDFGEIGAGTFSVSVSSAFYGGAIELHLDRPDGTLIGTLTISCTGGEDNWAIKTTNITGATGIHNLFFVFRGKATGNLFKVDYWQFEPKSPDRELIAINASMDNYKIDITTGINTAKMTVTAFYSNGSSEDVTSQADVVPDQEGRVSIKHAIVTGLSYGSTHLNVNYGGKTDTLSILIKDVKQEFSVKKLTVDNNKMKLRSGTNSYFTITAEYYDGHIENVTNIAAYINPKPEVALVSNGMITSYASGITDVIISYQGMLGDAVSTEISITVIEYLNPYEEHFASDMDQQYGVQTENSSEGVRNVGFIDHNDWIMYQRADFGNGAVSFEVKAASEAEGGNIELRLDSPTGPLVGTCRIDNTGGWQKYAIKSCTVTDATGVHDIYLKFTGGKGFLFNLIWWKFNQ